MHKFGIQVSLFFCVSKLFILKFSSMIIDQNRIIIIEMEDASCFLSESDRGQSQKPFECSCGKGYKSYPALYTHIKNKHDGKAPGNIKKPNFLNKKRGRPSTRNLATTPLQNIKSKENLSCSFLSSQQLQQTFKSDTDDSNCIKKLANILKSLPNEKLNRSHLNQISSILQMNVYLVSCKSQSNELFIGTVLSNFFTELSQHTSWQFFEQIYTLIMLLVQYIIDELNNNKIIKEGPVDLLCDFINDFLQIGVQGMIDQYQIRELSIFNEDAMLEIFELFFQWMMIKKYTNYKISLNCGFKKVETRAQF